MVWASASLATTLVPVVSRQYRAVDDPARGTWHPGHGRARHSAVPSDGQHSRMDPDRQAYRSTGIFFVTRGRFQLDVLCGPLALGFSLLLPVDCAPLLDDVARAQHSTVGQASVLDPASQTGAGVFGEEKKAGRRSGQPPSSGSTSARVESRTWSRADAQRGTGISHALWLRGLCCPGVHLVCQS